jgi:hypothetical protein
MSELVVCAACRRHVRVSESACPFCRAIRVAAASGLLASTLAAGTLPAHAQEAPRYEERMVHPLYGLPPPPPKPTKNAVQADLGLGIVGLAYERVVAPRVALQVEGQVFGTWWGPTFDLPNFSGFGAQLRPTFFLTRDAPRGVYLAPFFRAAVVSAKVDDRTAHGFGSSSGAFLGYSFVFGQAFNLRIGAGAQSMTYRAHVDQTYVSWTRLYPALDLVLGYGF